MGVNQTLKVLYNLIKTVSPGGPSGGGDVNQQPEALRLKEH